MRPYIAEILEHAGQTHTLPRPAKLRELKECVRALGLKDEADEEDMRVVGYKSLIVPTPSEFEPRLLIIETADNLARLNDEQIKAVSALCDAFALTFGDLGSVLNTIYPNVKEYDYEETE